MPNVTMIAYLGDAVYELFVRKYLLTLNLGKIELIQKKSLNYVSAKSQRHHLERLMNNNFLNDQEIEYIKKGRNTKAGKSKSTDIITYRHATGLEYLIGILYYQNEMERLNQIMMFILDGGV